MTERPIKIKGGAGPFEAAAIAAVIQHLLDIENAGRAKPPAAPVPPAWVRSGMARPFGRFAPSVEPEWGSNSP